jgi:hypothetical protein
MALKVQPFDLWSAKIEDAVGGADRVLAPLAAAKLDLQFVLVRRTAEEPGKGLLFVAPVQGAAAEPAARAAGLAPAGVYALRLEGGNRPGAGHAITGAVAAAGLSFKGLSASVLGGKYVAWIGFDAPADRDRAADALRALEPAKPRAAAKKKKKGRRRK